MIINQLLAMFPNDVIISDNIVVHVAGDNAHLMLSKIKNQLGFDHLIDVIPNYRGQNNLEVLILLSLDANAVIFVERLKEIETEDYISKFWKNYHWFDGARKISLGVNNSYIINNISNLYKWNGLEILKRMPLENGRFLNFRHDLLLDEDRVLQSVIEAGYVSKGIATTALKQDILEIDKILNRTGSDCSLFYQNAWLMMLEDLLHIDIPERAKIIRMILLEFNRIYEHLNCFIKMAESTNSVFMRQQAVLFKETIFKLLSVLTPNTIFQDQFILGGVTTQIPSGWIAEAFEVIGYLEDQIELFFRDFIKNPFFAGFTKRHTVSKQCALENSFSGPNLRACGINFDIRKRSPYYLYSDVQFSVPQGILGQSYDRIIVRVEEIKQSLTMLAQLLENMPHSDLVAQEVLDMKKIKSEILQLSCVKHSLMETPNGFASIFAIFNKGPKLQNFSFVASDLQHLAGFQNMMIGESIYDLDVIHSSLNINICDADR